MKIYFKKNYSSSIEANTAIVLQVQNVKNSFGLTEVDPKGIATKSYVRENFQGAFGSQIKLLYPEGSPVACLKVIGLGKKTNLNDEIFLKVGGLCLSNITKTSKIIVFIDASVSHIMHFVLGMLLKNYSFNRYHTRKNNANSANLTKTEVTFITENAYICQQELQQVTSLCRGVNLTKELVNEPANVLGTCEFVEKIKQLRQLGVEVEILEKEALEQLGANALLGVAQGAARPPYLAIMKWHGDKDATLQPIAFVGKGVVFDTGGISIKPSLNMGNMKSDMAGAAAVVGLMHTLADRKAKVNVVGVVGLVENMPSSNALRPGDIIKSMSGQTIEVINTDAEGRLVLADALWYCKTQLKPKFMIDLATLTGAIVVSLGSQYAGLFANDDQLAQQLIHSGQATAEKVWQMPLSQEYDQLIDSRFADMRNSVSNYGAGSITAAQFLKRFVGEDIPWAHIDIAGVAAGKTFNEFNTSWASGFGVRLLNHLIQTYYEKNK
ncbi:leucyl aminopeptidase [Candidatus Phytoplasma solani]|uniref:leucyl aminopeptidase n=1 Tax=Candidatus Phytoplasma solani TaxID=69896 RepID=UPI00358EB167